MIKKISSNIDNKKFYWLFNRLENKSPYPPLVWQNESIFYQLNDFNKKTDTFFLLECDILTAIQSSIDFYNLDTINIIELSNLYQLFKEFNISSDSINLFKSKGIKGKKHYQILEEIISYNKIFKKYIAEKDISLKLLSIYQKLSTNNKKILMDFIEKINPSVSNFRKFINMLFDYGRKIEIDYYDKKYFEKLVIDSNKLKSNFEKEFYLIISQLKEFNITNNDNFETILLNICFQISSYEDFEKKLDYLNDNKAKIKEIFNLLERYDLY